MGMVVCLSQEEVTQYVSVVEWIAFLQLLDSGDVMLLNQVERFIVSTSTLEMALHMVRQFISCSFLKSLFLCNNRRIKKNCTDQFYSSH